MNRNINISRVPNAANELRESISHGDGALELEPPVEGSTLESAPDGGVRAWLIVLSCTGINALLSILQILIRASVLDINMSTDTGIDSDTQNEMIDQLVALSDMYAPLAAIVMIVLGYRATICIGSSVVMTALIYLSYIGDDDTGQFIKFILYGPVAIGISFIQLGALVPVLEYFTTKRMKALFLSTLGTFVGQFILIAILVTAQSQVTVKWREFLRGCSGLCIGIGLLGFTLKELKLKLKDEEAVTFVQKTIGLAKEDILKNVFFWLTCVVYFFYQWGIETPQAQLTDSDMIVRLDIRESIAQTLLFSLSPTIGLALGMFLAWMFKKAAYHENSRVHARTLKDSRINIIFGILVAAAATMGVGCFIAPNEGNFGYFFPFSLLFATFFAFCEGMRDDAIPEEFGRENIRIVEGLILMFAGLGGIITNEIGADIDDGKEDDWEILFRYGGGMLLLSSIVTAFVLFLKLSKILNKIQSKIDSNSVVPLRTNTSQQNGNRVNIRQTHQNSDLVKNQKFRPRQRHNAFTQEQTVDRSVDTQPYRQPGMQSADHNSGVPPYQPGVPSTAQIGNYQTYMQPGVSSAGHNSGVPPYQPGVQSATQNGSNQPYEQPDVSPAGHNSDVQPYQPGVPTDAQNGFQPYQYSSEPTVDQTTASNGGYQRQQTVSHITMHEL